MTKEQRLQRGLLFVGEIAELANVLPSHIAFYTREGILKVHSRTRGGFNLYKREETLKRLSEIKRSQKKSVSSQKRMWNRLTKDRRLKEKLLFVGEVAELARVLPSQIAFYTRQGLLKVHSQTRGRFNLYKREETLRKLSRIKKQRKKGFVLREGTVKELLKDRRRREGLLLVGEVAALADVLSSHIAFYTREGILKVHSRTRGGFNLYQKEETLKQLALIGRLQEQGFTLEEIKERVK